MERLPTLHGFIDDRLRNHSTLSTLRMSENNKYHSIFCCTLKPAFTYLHHHKPPKPINFLLVEMMKARRDSYKLLLKNKKKEKQVTVSQSELEFLINTDKLN